MSDLKRMRIDMDDAIFEAEVKLEQEKWDKMLAMKGTENAYLIHKELVSE